MRGSAVPSCCSIPFPMHRKEGPLLSANTALRGVSVEEEGEDQRKETSWGRGGCHGFRSQLAGRG